MSVIKELEAKATTYRENDVLGKVAVFDIEKYTELVVDFLLSKVKPPEAKDNLNDFAAGFVQGQNWTYQILESYRKV